jgi:hypothetical protein
MEFAFLAYRLAQTPECTDVVSFVGGWEARAIRVGSIHQDAALSVLYLGLLAGALLLGARLLKRGFIRRSEQEGGLRRGALIPIPTKSRSTDCRSIQ